MDRIYFISDVHLGAHSEEIEKIKTSRLLSFLKSIQNQADYLYIVGDLYDFWFEYYQVIPKVNLKVLSRLNQLVESGTVVRYFIGNHDLWHGTYLENELGVKIYHEPLVINHNTLKLFIAHGDGLVEGEWKLRFIKRIFKNRCNIFLYRLLHPDLAIPLARYVSNKSKRKGENRFIEDFRKFAFMKFEEGFDAVILGHTHRPVFENNNTKFYINLGDWFKSFTYLQLIRTSFELKSWR